MKKEEIKFWAARLAELNGKYFVGKINADWSCSLWIRNEIPNQIHWTIKNYYHKSRHRFESIISTYIDKYIRLICCEWFSYWITFWNRIFRMDLRLKFVFLKVSALWTRSSSRTFGWTFRTNDGSSDGSLKISHILGSIFQCSQTHSNGFDGGGWSDRICHPNFRWFIIHCMQFIWWKFNLNSWSIVIYAWSWWTTWDAGDGWIFWSESRINLSIPFES